MIKITTGTVLIVILGGALVLRPAMPVRSEGKPAPALRQPVLFDTPEADAILAGLQVFPPDSPWNQDVSVLPVQANSAAIIASIGADRHIDFNLDMNFVLVPPDQKRVPVKI